MSVKSDRACSQIHPVSDEQLHRWIYWKSHFVAWNWSAIAPCGHYTLQHFSQTLRGHCFFNNWWYLKVFFSLIWSTLVYFQPKKKKEKEIRGPSSPASTPNSPSSEPNQLLDRLSCVLEVSSLISAHMKTLPGMCRGSPFTEHPLLACSKMVTASLSHQCRHPLFTDAQSQCSRKCLSLQWISACARLLPYRSRVSDSLLIIVEPSPQCPSVSDSQFPNAFSATNVALWAGVETWQYESCFSAVESFTLDLKAEMLFADKFQ